MPSVLFVAPSAYLLSGLATWLDYLVPGLSAAGWDARLALVSGPKYHRPERYLAAHPVRRTVVAHSRTGTAEGRSRALAKLLREMQPDIAVSVNIPDLFVAINELRQAKSSSPHAVMSVHGIEAFLYADASRYSRMLDAVICTNRLAGALTNSLAGIESDRILYAPYGVRKPEVETPLRHDGRLCIAYSGRLESAQKRAGDLVGIVHGLKRRDVPFQLEIAGDGPDRESLETALESEIAEGSVRFHGHVPHDDLESTIYPLAHALLITSHWETGPIVAWEAMAQGLAVVSSRYVGSGLEGALVDGSNALLFDIGDVDAAASALSRLWLDEPTRRGLALAGSRLVAQRYSIPASVSAWSSALCTVLERGQCQSAALPRLAQSGRLDRWVGMSRAETLRKALPFRSAAALDPGGEWPHAHAKVESDAEFWRVAMRSDAAGRTAEPSHVG